MEVVALISFLAILACLVSTIVSAIKKNGKVKKWGDSPLKNRIAKAWVDAKVGPLGQNHIK